MPCNSTAGTAPVGPDAADWPAAAMAHAPGRADEETLDRRCPESTVYRTPRATILRPLGVAVTPSLRRRGNRDRPRDDLCLVLLDRCLEGADLRVRRRVADTVVLQAESDVPGLELTLRVLLDEVVHGGVDPLQRRGQDQGPLVRGCRLVLVGVDADR